MNAKEQADALDALARTFALKAEEAEKDMKFFDKLAMQYASDAASKRMEASDE